MPKTTPCDYGDCPYYAMRWSDCEYWCKVGYTEEPDMDEIFDDFDILPVEYINCYQEQ